MNNSNAIPVNELGDSPLPAEVILQNEGLKTNPIQYAGFWKRASAFIYDVVVLRIALYPISYLIAFVLLAVGVNSSSVRVVLTITGIVVTWLYFALQESSAKQATWGKRIFEIKVTNLDNSRISFVMATVRYFAKILSGLLFGIGYIMAGTTEKKQALHDMIAGTLVVDK